MTFQLLRLQPDPHALATWATRHGVLSPDGDFGYALHALLTTAFGELAPKPFSYRGERQGLLAYTTAPLASLRLNARLATPEVARALGLDELDARPFPTAWQPGQFLGFELRARPVVRTKDGRERDVFLQTIDAGGGTGLAPVTDHGALVQRAAIYTEWLNKQLALNGAAQIDEVRLDAFRLTRVLRKDGSGENGGRKITNKAGPDAVFKGRLQVGNGEAFANLLARGVGRHRAFGFGMLLLRPATTC